VAYLILPPSGEAFMSSSLTACLFVGVLLVSPAVRSGSSDSLMDITPDGNRLLGIIGVSSFFPPNNELTPIILPACEQRFLTP
jgi:hypothetical protein